jgi:hypothetical protein
MLFALSTTAEMLVAALLNLVVPSFGGIVYLTSCFQVIPLSRLRQKAASGAMLF